MNRTNIQPLVAKAIYDLRAEGYDTGSQLILKGEFAIENLTAIRSAKILRSAGLLVPDPSSGLTETYRIPELAFEKFTEFLRENPDFIDSLNP